VNARLDLPAQPRILVVALRRLGDVLLTTPLVRSLRRAYADARIDMLVFADTASILEGNPDIDGVITCPSRPSTADSIALARAIFRRYDLAITTQAGDRPSFFAIMAGRRRVGVAEDRLIGRIKSMLLHRHLPMRDDLHRVEETLALAELIGIPPVAEVVPPVARPVPEAPARPYAVLHAAPFFRYKQWRTDGWRAAAQHLSASGLALVATGGPAPEERAYLDAVWEGTDILRLDGRLKWPQLAGLIAQARVFLGPDTSVTHLAAATGCPTVALFGPTDPRRWAPWPVDGPGRPFATRGTVQRQGNVFVVQNRLPCMPCGLEGCLRHVRSHSLCLDRMPVEDVIRTLDTALASPAPAGGQEGGAVPQTPLCNR